MRGKTKHRRIEDQVVVVMGASTGIGRLLASEVGRRGARVVVAARSQGPLDQLVAEIRDRGGHAFAVIADTTSPGDNRSVAEAAEREFGRLDTWVQMAGVAVYAPFEKLTPEEFEQVVRVDLLGQAFGAMAALPVMRRHGGGAFVAVSSVESEVALPYHAPYAAAKHGIRGMLDALRLELRQENAPISITNVMPASINTPFFDHARTKLGVKPRPLPPVYDPALVVDAIIKAAEKPRREIVVGGAGRLWVALHRRYPRLVEAGIRRTGFRGQESREPRAEGHPDNVDGPTGIDTRVRGDEAMEARGGPVRRRRRQVGKIGKRISWFGLGAAAVSFLVRGLILRRVGHGGIIRSFAIAALLRAVRGRHRRPRLRRRLLGFT